VPNSIKITPNPARPTDPLALSVTISGPAPMGTQVALAVDGNPMAPLNFAAGSQQETANLPAGSFTTGSSTAGTYKLTATLNGQTVETLFTST
jgi:hypothetical protein